MCGDIRRRALRRNFRVVLVPDHRPKNVGSLLIETAILFARKRGWPNVEVGAPGSPRWKRTVDFYLRHGFEEIGPRLDLELEPGG
jgi:GNAT superfamily N-acetyltransferase